MLSPTSWLVTFQATPEYLEKHSDEPRISIRVQTPMEGRAVSLGWDQMLKVRRFASKENHFHYSTVQEVRQ